ncbi:MAG: sterol desaturase family protein, partial [Hyphomicrobiales bacterium]|nr:sterol desaturase family protein [Hyphomicrobiales bacterium]
TIGFTYASPVTIGLMFGYLCYVVVHHVTHHWRVMPDSPLYRFKHRHARHHYAKIAGNFGVTTLFWDEVFGTSLEAGSRDNRFSWMRGFDRLLR